MASQEANGHGISAGKLKFCSFIKKLVLIARDR